VGRCTRYPYSTRWLDEFDDPLLADRLYSHSFPLADVTTIHDDEIMQHHSMAALTLLQKRIRQWDRAELMDRLVSILMAGDHFSSQVISLVNYIVQAGEASDVKTFVLELAQRVSQHENALMTVAQQLEQIGLEKGIAQGRIEGKETGFQRGRQSMQLRIARTMLTSGMDRNTVMPMAGLIEDELAKISP